MKIVDNRDKRINFQDLNLGDLFYVNDRDGLFIKIYTMKIGEYSMINALQIDSNYLGTSFEMSNQVIPVRATLTLE